MKQANRNEGSIDAPGYGDIALRLKDLAKSYGKVRALRGINLEVRRGEIFGFLGPNGAGKTTTIRCLLDTIRPDDGEVRLLGLNPQDQPVEVQTRIGYLPGEMQFYENYTAERQLRYFSDMRGSKADWAFTKQLAARLALDLTKPIKSLSKGNKQKVGVIQALMHRPEFLLLDEPTSGLDPLMQKEVMVLLREANTAGSTVFFSSHIISEVESAAERVAIIREGEIVALVGANGAGKTTLLKTISGIVRPAAGGVSFQGKAIERLPPADIVELGAVVADPTLGRTGPADVTVADLTGVAVQDIVVAEMAVRGLTAAGGDGSGV